MRLLHRLFLLGPALLLAGCGAKQEGEPLLVGHVAPLKLGGAKRFVGEHARRGIALAVERVNEEGNRIEGRRIVVLHADSRGDPDRAKSEAVRLITVNRVQALIGGADHATAKAFASAVQPYAAPLLTPAALPDAVARQEGVFSLDVRPEFRGETLARFAAAELKAGKAVVVADDNEPVSSAIASAFAAEWRSGGKRQVRRWSLDEKPDFQELAARVGKEKPEVLVFAGSADGLTKLRSSFVEKAEVPLLFAGPPTEWAVLQRDAEASKDVYAATVYAPASFTEEGKAFVKRYQEAHNEAPDLFAYQGYESAAVLFQAMRDTGGVGGAKLREELRKEREFDGLTGKLTFESGHARRPLYVIRAGGGKPKEYKPAE